MDWSSTALYGALTQEYGVKKMDLISRQKEIKLINSMPTFKDSDGMEYIEKSTLIIKTELLEPEQPKQETLSIEEVAYELGCNNLESAYYWADFLQKLYELDFRVVRKNET